MKLVDTCFEGVEYRMVLNMTDIATIPVHPNTTVEIGNSVGPMRPTRWPADAANPAVRVEVENESDAKTATLIDECHKAWSAFEFEVTRRRQWLNLIGVHQDILQRMDEPLAARIVTVRTASPLFLPTMFTLGSFNAAAAAAYLRDIEREGREMRMPYRKGLNEFLWPPHAIPENLQPRYRKACTGNFGLIEFHTPEQEDLDEGQSLAERMRDEESADRHAGHLWGNI
jgi:hypothetical protein